jgi:hypothetical protein
MEATLGSPTTLRRKGWGPGVPEDASSLGWGSGPNEEVMVKPWPTKRIHMAKPQQAICLLFDWRVNNTSHPSISPREMDFFSANL